MKKTLFFIAILFISFGCQEEEYRDEIYDKPEIVADPSVDFLSPEESLKKFYLPAGYQIELVASEPMVHEPVAIEWDGNGRMYVAEMNTYMQNVDGDGTDDPICQVKQLTDRDGDGVMDTSIVFIDSLVLPRLLLPLDDRVIINETYTHNLWSYRDTDGDGVADEKIEIYANPDPRGGNLEHQQSGLIWNLDNWIYVTTLPVRFRFTNGVMEVDTLDKYPGGQWGLTQDDLGNMYYSSAGGENPAYGFQQPAVYGYFNPEGRLAKGFIKPWPVVGTPDVQGGAERRLREDGTLNNFTGVAGQEIFRGHSLPPSTYGDLFIPEPVGRLIRRAKVENYLGKKILHNAYHEKEFLASTDLNFRPVQAKTGPDGCLYIVDMYRGIIQESAWTREGSHIRPVIVRKGLDKNIGKGRIYRIRHEQIEPDSKPNLLDKTSDELLEFLGHPNGWYRITAQKLIILKGDLSVVPKIEKMAQDNESFLSRFRKSKVDFGMGRIHALWTLEGLGILNRNLIMDKISDKDPRVRITAIRLSENFLKENDLEVLNILKSMEKDDLEVVNQIALSLRYFSGEESSTVLNKWSKIFDHNYIISESIKESLKKDDTELQQLLAKIRGQGQGTRNRLMRGYEIQKQTCLPCHGPDLMGMPGGNNSMIAPPLIGSPRVLADKSVSIKILLDGLSGKVDGTDYGTMLPMKENNDGWISSVLSYVRFMNDTTLINGGEVRKVREENKDRNTYWTINELGF